MKQYLASLAHAVDSAYAQHGADDQPDVVRIWGVPGDRVVQEAAGMGIYHRLKGQQRGRPTYASYVIISVIPQWSGVLVFGIVGTVRV